MVFIGPFWGDIYLSSDNGASGLQSKKGVVPITGTEGLNWYIANERAMRVGKRLPTYAEFCKGAYGSPQGENGNNTYAWSATSNTARTTCGNVKNAVSATNVRDLVGNVWKWLDEFIHDPTGSSWNWYDRSESWPALHGQQHWLARAHWRWQLGPRGSRWLADCGLRRLSVEREHGRWRVVRL